MCASWASLHLKAFNLEIIWNLDPNAGDLCYLCSSESVSLLVPLLWGAQQAAIHSICGGSANDLGSAPTLQLQFTNLEANSCWGLCGSVEMWYIFCI